MKFLIEDMTCGHCAGRVTKAIVAVDISADVRIDLAVKIATVSTLADAERIADAIAAAGYTPLLHSE